MEKEEVEARKRRNQAIGKKKSRRNIFELTYLQKKHIQRQRKSIKEAFRHLKDPNRPIKNEELINYSFQLSTIIDLTLDPLTAKYGRKVLDYINRYIDYRRGQPKKQWNPNDTSKLPKVSKKEKPSMDTRKKTEVSSKEHQNKNLGEKSY